jgi:hypothetical protein
MSAAVADGRSVGEKSRSCASIQVRVHHGSASSRAWRDRTTRERAWWDICGWGLDGLASMCRWVVATVGRARRHGERRP